MARLTEPDTQPRADGRDSPGRVLEFTVTAESHGARLDVFLAGSVPDATRAYASE
jgi:hypothetical protein